MSRIGRPSSYDEETAAIFLQRVRAGETVSRICSDPHMPSWDVICTWRRSHPDFAASYACAKSDSADMHASLAVDFTSETADPQKARVQMQARQWIAAKYDRAQYGDRLDLSVDHRVDIPTALAQARQRVRLLRDEDATRDAQVIDITPSAPPALLDGTSDSAPDATPSPEPDRTAWPPDPLFD